MASTEVSTEVRQILVDNNCIIEGEFFFALKKETMISRKYINIDPVFVHWRSVARLGQLLVDEFQNEFDVLAGPAVGGIPLVCAGAAALVREVQTVWTDKVAGDVFKFTRRGFERAVRGKRVLVLEDFTSSGDSAKSVCDRIKEANGSVVGVSCIWNRGRVTAEYLGVPRISALIDEHIESWYIDRHPMWGTWPLVENEGLGHPEYFPYYKPRILLPE